MDSTRRYGTVAWWVAGVLGFVGLVYAGVMAFFVLDSMNWDLFVGNLDWSAGQTIAPPKKPQIPPGMQLGPLGPPGSPGTQPAPGQLPAPQLPPPPAPSPPGPPR